MHEGGDRDTFSFGRAAPDPRAFGRRRPPEPDFRPLPAAPEAADAWSEAARPAGTLRWALRTAALAGFAALFAAQYLVRVSGPVETPVARVAQGPLDPETTGSIAAARATRLDPCAAALARGRP